MLTYIIRRLLYSSVVLVLASFLVFTFVTVSGDPLAGLRIAPNVSEQTVQNVIDRKHLDDPIAEALPLLGAGRVHEPVRVDAPRQPADHARALARDEEHAAARARSPQLLVDLLRRLDRRLLRDKAVLRLRLHDDDLQLPRTRDAGLLAGTDGPGGGRPDLRAYGAPIVPDREPELGRPRHRR